MAENLASDLPTDPDEPPSLGDASAAAATLVAPPVDAGLGLTVGRAIDQAPGPSDASRVIPWKRYRDRISYSACNEDSCSELSVIRPGPAKRLVCIGAGGGRVLNLLEDGADEIWAVDVNPSQTYLLELKASAIRSLAHGEYLDLLGVRASERRFDLYDRLRLLLSAAARSYFDSRPEIVSRGVLYQGSLERFLARYVAPITHLPAGRWIDRLFDCACLAEQSRLLPRWNTPVFRFVAQTICRKGFFGLFSRDPGFWRFVPAEIKLHERIFELLHRYLEHHLARENPLLWLVFYGRYADERIMPRYLLAEPFERIKAALAKVRFEVMQGELGRVLENAPPGHFDGYSLSDISSYLGQQAFEATMDQVLRTARRGARLCSRGIFFHRPLPPDHLRHLEQDQALARQLELDDHAMVHTFFVGRKR
jgi:S-adenosylmethionine:diacylglycerol 3-amino-3-carboxypropyl transferase